MATETSNFGVSRREAHDSTAFYARFERPELTSDDTVLPPFPVDEPCRNGDSRSMGDLPDGSVALVVTSPPYFAGKQYEEELDRDGVPASYGEYLELLHDVFAECKRTLEPGGRIAVNVANLGRKPYRSLAADVIWILQDRLGLLLRGEILWRKAEGAGGNCAWGSFRSPANPVLRDLTERVIVASKGRFDRAKSAKEREKLGLPHRTDLAADDFMQRTLDVWEVPTESAKRVGHPAPFPVELPEKLIQLYTYRDDLVLDPFLGSGSTVVAAARLGRRGVGYDLDPAYVEIARERLAAEAADPVPERDGIAAKALAEQLLAAAGLRVSASDVRFRGLGLSVDFEVETPDGRTFVVDVAGANTSHRGGLLRAETLWRTIGRASVLRQHDRWKPLLVLSPQVPRPGSDGDAALAAAVEGGTIHAVVAMLEPDAADVLRAAVSR